MGETQDIIVVTGGSGFIGTNLVAELSNHGYEVVNLDIKEPLDYNYHKLWRKCDVSCLESISKSLEGKRVTHIFHLAAIADLSGNDKNYYRSNVEGIQAIIEYIKNEYSKIRLIVYSTMLVNSVGNEIVENNFSYTTPYGESKALMEQQLYDSTGIDWVILRPTSIWGPWMTNTSYFKFFQLIRAGKYVYFDERYAANKTYGYVENVVTETIYIAFFANEVKSIYYLGDIEPINIVKWALEIARVFDVRKPVRVPIIFVKLAAIIGSLLMLIKVPFPLSLFRLNNMTTDNIIPNELLLQNCKPKNNIDALLTTKTWLERIEDTTKP